MNPQTENKLLRLAERIRCDLVEIYRGQFHTKNHQEMFLLDNGCWRFFDDDYAGACGVASYMLQLAARKEDIHLKMAGHAGHCFCKSGDGTVIDPTYSQFVGRIPIYIGTPKTQHLPSDNYPVFEGDGVKELLRRYPKIQNPFSDYHNKTIQRWLNSL